MANDEILTDDYVAELLAKDAKESSIKYSSLGLEAFTNSKPPANKPKPNTRFLRNIIKDTDSHNAALLAKEAAEARARLRVLGGNEHREEKASRLGGGSIRRRQLGDIAAILGGKPKKRVRVGTGERRVNTSSEDEEAEEKSKVESPRHKGSREDKDDKKDERKSRSHRSHHRRHRSISRSEQKPGDDRRRRHRSRSRSPREHRSKETRHRDRSRSPREHRSKESKYRDRSPRRKRSKTSEGERAKEKPSLSNKDMKDSEKKTPGRGKQTQEKKAEPKPDSDSDPLDDIIGPRPPAVPKVRTRGRGTISQASGIDARFSASYDPTADVQIESDEELDWDQAVENYRDRQKFKKHGADRLRAAGFTEDQIKKWEQGGEEREEDVKWAKKGEGREWDRGKVLDDDGVVSWDPDFGRLKDT